MAKLTSTGVSALKSLMDDMTADPVKNAAGVVFVAVNKQGESLFEHASGTAGLGIDTPITTDHSFWIASCTKMITGLACMQLVEQGILALDDVELVERLCPVSSISSSLGVPEAGYNNISALRQSHFLAPCLALTNPFPTAIKQELKEVKVIEGNQLVPKKRGITLRMLLSHTGQSPLGILTTYTWFLKLHVH